MEIFGITIGRTKALNLSPVRSGASWWATVREPFAGAWQKNIECESPRNILAFSAVYACVSLIANDIAKLRIKLVQLSESGVWIETTSPAFSPVLRKPNRYQTRIQFICQWITSKRLYGNTYVLKERDNRGVVVEMFVLDPRLVTVLVADDGSVYYQLKKDALSGLADEQITLPASEIIHDRMLTLWHPLIGVSPIFACGSSATQGIRIQNNSARFFENMSRPSIHLAAPGKIDEPTANRIKQTVENATGGGNIGRVLVTGDGMKMDIMTIPASDAQLIEQLRWTVEDVARCFHVPLHKLGMGQPTLNNIGALNQDYYSQALQSDIESIELLLDEGLGLDKVPSVTYGTELDLEGLLRMDPLSRADKNEKAIRAGYMKPNEARASEDMLPVAGGDTPYMQQQNYSLRALDKRDAKPDPFATTPNAAPPALPDTPDATDSQDATAAKAMREAITAATAEGFESVRAETKAALEKMAADIPEAIAKAMPQPVDEYAAFMTAIRAKFLAEA